MVIRCGYADTSIGQIHYREYGAGPPLLLLHPAPRSSRIFKRVMPLVEHANVLAVDLPGFGESCDLPADASMESIAAVMVEFFDALRIEKARVFGLHSGNKVGAALAANAPDRVEHFVLAGMRHSILLDAERRNEAMRHYVANKRPVPREEDPEAFDDEQLDKLQCQRAYDALYAANYSFDLAAALARVRVPTLVLELAVAAEDALGSPGKEICERMHDAQLVTLHCNDRELLQSQPAELARVLHEVA